MSTAQRVSRGFHLLGLLLAVVMMPAITTGYAAPCEQPATVQTGAIENSSADTKTSLEAQTLERMVQFERGLRNLNLDEATTERLLKEGLANFLKGYCLQSQLQKQKQ